MTEQNFEPVHVDRPLTEEEYILAHWMLTNGSSEGGAFLDQLDRARVVEHCSCGCPTIGFKIDGLPEAPPGVGILGDFLFGEGDETGGAFVYESDGILSGLEIFGYGHETPAKLPSPSQLRKY